MWNVLIPVIVAIVVGFVAFIAGFLYRKSVSEKAIGSAELEATRIVNEAIKTADTKKKEAMLEAREVLHKERVEQEKEFKERRSEIKNQENRLLQREENLEKKRIAAQEKAGFSEMKAEEIIEKITDEKEKQSFTSTVNELRTLVEEIQRLNKISIDIAKSNLKIANTILQQQSSDEAGVYTSTGSNAKWSSSSFEEKI